MPSALNYKMKPLLKRYVDDIFYFTFANVNGRTDAGGRVSTAVSRGPRASSPVLFTLCISSQRETGAFVIDSIEASCTTSFLNVRTKLL